MDSAPSASSLSLSHLPPMASGDSLSITTIRTVRSEEFHVSIATDGGSASGTALTLTSSAGYSRTSTRHLLESTFEGFALCRLMDADAEREDDGRYPEGRI